MRPLKIILCLSCLANAASASGEIITFKCFDTGQSQQIEDRSAPNFLALLKENNKFTGARFAFWEPAPVEYSNEKFLVWTHFRIDETSPSFSDNPQFARFLLNQSTGELVTAVVGSGEQEPDKPSAISGYTLRQLCEPN